MRKLFTLASLALILHAASAPAITWKYGNLNSSTLQCRLTGWSGNEPSSGKLTVPSYYVNPADGKSYTVVSIGDGALDSLKTVTQITIPASINRIGDSGKGKGNADDQFAYNFRGCPKLSKFIVASDNKYYKTSSHGCLMVNIENRINTVLVVPSDVATTNGKLTLTDEIQRISNEAFAGNTSVKTLELDSEIAINDNGGLNQAKNISKYIVTEREYSDPDIKLVNDVLYNVIAGLNDVISLPPASSRTSVKLPSDVAWVYDYAFYGCSKLKSIDLAKVTYIGDNAFARSGLTSVTVPSTVTYLGEGAFQNCKSLQTIDIKADISEIRKYTARNCTALTKVTLAKIPAQVKDYAFQGCKSLTSYPFTAGTSYYESCFQSCGFKKVVFSGDQYNGISAPRNMFASNASLEEIDMSAIPGTDKDSFDYTRGFAANCKNLTTMKFPKYIDFMSCTGEEGAAFGPGCALSKIVVGCVTNSSNVEQFVYAPTADKTNFRPRVFVAATGLKYVNMYYNGLFGARQGATVAPDFIIDLYKPSGEGNYVDSKATYYVPGGAKDNYKKAAKAGCTVKEFFTVDFARSGDRLYLAVYQNERPSRVPSLSDITVDFGDGDVQDYDTGGSSLSRKAYWQVKKVKVSYTCSGVRMSTEYTGLWNFSGIDAVEDDGLIGDEMNENDVEYYTIDGLKVETPAPGTIYIERHPNGKTNLRRM